MVMIFSKKKKKKSLENLTKYTVYIDIVLLHT